jgi:hypothetical protein
VLSHVDPGGLDVVWGGSNNVFDFGNGANVSHVFDISIASPQAIRGI